MKYHLKKVICLLSLILFLFIAFSCMSAIAEIKKNPSYYNGQEVYVGGVVTKLKLLNESKEYYSPTPLYLYVIKDDFDEIAVLSTNIAYAGNYKKVNGKLIVFKNNLYESEIQFAAKEIAEYLLKKNALPSSKEKEAQKAFISIIAAIINIFTDGKLSEPVNTISQGAQTIVDSNLEEVDKQYIEQVIQSLLNYLPKDEYYYLILEN